MPDSWWTTDADYGGNFPRTPNEMREAAHRTIGMTALSSAAEIEMAKVVLWLLDQIAAVKGQT